MTPINREGRLPAEQQRNTPSQCTYRVDIMHVACRSPCLSKLFTQIPTTAAAAPLSCTLPSGISRCRVRYNSVLSKNANGRLCRSLAAFATSSATESSSSTAAAALPVVYHPLYPAPQLAAGHRFPMQVFGRIYERLLQQDIVKPSQVHTPESLPTDEQLSLVHCPDYLLAFSSCTLDGARVRRIGFGEATRTRILVDRTKAEVAGTLLTAQLALQHGLACNTAGGTHHAYADAGSGFCILNDLAYTAAVLLKQKAVQRVLILDLDVHQGDGTAATCAGNPGIFTLSVHAANNFPARKQQSSLDVPLPDGLGDSDYLAVVAEVLPEVLASFKPDLVLYDAGVDVHIDDALGRLAVTDTGLMRRELLVFNTCLAAGVPVAGYVGGGYASDLNVLAERHMLLHKAAVQMWQGYELHLGKQAWLNSV